jgi:hypothetical protein
MKINRRIRMLKRTLWTTRHKQHHTHRSHSANEFLVVSPQRQRQQAATASKCRISRQCLSDQPPAHILNLHPCHPQMPTDGVNGHDKELWQCSVAVRHL